MNKWKFISSDSNNHKQFDAELEKAACSAHSVCVDIFQNSGYFGSEIPSCVAIRDFRGNFDYLRGKS